MSDRVVWDSVTWPDGSTYEGLSKNDRCHVRGVFTYKNGDRYMGEYLENEMDGYGVYVWQSGTVYRGEWKESGMHGCGVKMTKQKNGKMLTEEGEFAEDEWKGETRVCSVKDARKAAAHADVAAQMASVFQLDRTDTEESSVKTRRADAILKKMERDRSCKKKQGFWSFLSQ